MPYVLACAEVVENSKGLRLLNRYARDPRRSYEKAMREFSELHNGDDPAQELSADHDGYQAVRIAMDAAIFHSVSFR